MNSQWIIENAGSFVDQNLMQRKIDLFTSMNSENFFKMQARLGESENSLYFDFHGEKIFSLTTTEVMLNVLKSYLPLPSAFANGLTESLLPTTIFWFSPQDFDLYPDNFSSESNPDCLICENDLGECAIQRDFLARDDHRGHIFILTDPSNSDGIYNALRWALPRKMLSHSRMLLHSSCVLNSKNEAFLFLGHSGAGKTTVATYLSGGRKVLGDDMNVIYTANKILASQAYLGGAITPTDRDLNYFPVKGLYWLKQSDQVRLNQLDLGKSIQKIVASAANIFIGEEKNKYAFEVINMASTIVKQIPCYELEFRKTEEFWNVIESSACN